MDGHDGAPRSIVPRLDKACNQKNQAEPQAGLLPVANSHFAGHGTDTAGIIRVKLFAIGTSRKSMRNAPLGNPTCARGARGWGEDRAVHARTSAIERRLVLV